MTSNNQVTAWMNFNGMKLLELTVVKACSCIMIAVMKIQALASDHEKWREFDAPCKTY